MQCTEQEDRTDPLCMWTGGSNYSQLSREEYTISGAAKEDRDESHSVGDQE